MTNADDIDPMQIGPDPDKLLAYHRQQLSAMLDGELSPDEAKFMLRRLQHDGELAACWERWQVCGDMLRGSHHALLPSDFAERVAKGVRADAAVVPPTPQAARPPRLLRWGGGAALAASVALVAVFATRQLPDPAQSLPAPAAAQPAVASAIDAAPALPAADATNEAPGTPPLDAAATAMLATAVAVTELPRRSATRRATGSTRASNAQRPRAPSQALATMAVPEPTMLAASVPAASTPAVAEIFPSPPALQPRPWPRAILPGAIDAPFSVGHGRLSVLPVGQAGYDPFRPRDGLPVQGPVPEPGSEPADGEGVAQGNEGATH